MNINATLVLQGIVFLILVWFTYSYIRPPLIKALDERALKIAEGLAAADKAQAQLGEAQAQVSAQLASARDDSAKRLAGAESLAQSIVDAAKQRAQDEAAKIVADARAEAEAAVAKARDGLREQVAALAVKGAEQILRREVNAATHAELLDRLKAEL